MLAAVRARHAGLVEQQLKHLVLTRALATDNAWDRACQVGSSGAVGGWGRGLAMCVPIFCSAFATKTKLSVGLVTSVQPLIDFCTCI
jgi:hypothetical protein